MAAEGAAFCPVHRRGMVGDVSVIGLVVSSMSIFFRIVRWYGVLTSPSWRFPSIDWQGTRGIAGTGAKVALRNFRGVNHDLSLSDRR